MRRVLVRALGGIAFSWASACTPAPAAPTDEESAGDERAHETGCPRASAIRHAHARREPGAPRWGIALGRTELDEDQATADALDALGDVPPATVTREELLALGFEPGPDVVWLLRTDGAPCRAAITSFTATRVVDGLANLRYEAVTTDCVGSERDGAEAWVSDVEPGSDCMLREPALAGSVELVVSADGDVTVPTTRAPVPAPFATHLPVPVVTYADVEPEVLAAAPVLWSMRRARGAPDVVELWVSHVFADPPDSPCSWLSADYAGLHLGTGEPIAWPSTEDEPEGRPRTLAGLLVDGEATRVVLLTDHAWSGTYDLAGSTLTPGRALDEYIGHEEDGVFRSLGPYCGP